MEGKGEERRKEEKRRMNWGKEEKRESVNGRGKRRRKSGNGRGNWGNRGKKRWQLGKRKKKWHLGKLGKEGDDKEKRETEVTITKKRKRGDN